MEKIPLGPHPEFLTIICHELRNHIHNILCASNILMETSSAEDSKLIETINHSALRSMDFIGDIVEYSLLMRGKIQLVEDKNVNLEDCIQKAINIVQYDIQKHKSEISIDIQHNLPLFSSDCRRIEQIIVNLLSNAIKHAGGKIIVKVRFVRNEQEGKILFQIDVEDRGPGISKEVQKFIFIPFAAKSRMSSGIGIGLSICNRIASLFSNGRLIVESPINEIERGTKMSFCFDINISKSVFQPTIVLYKPINSINQQQPSIDIIFVIDDSPYNAEILGKLIKHIYPSCIIHTFSDPLVFVNYIKNNIHTLDKFVAFIDLIMPVLDGFDVCRAIYDICDNKGKKFQTVAITGLCGDICQMKKKCIDNGFHKYTEKPILKSTLVTLLNEINSEIQH